MKTGGAYSDRRLTMRSPGMFSPGMFGPGMFIVQIDGHGVAAEFTVSSPVVALDLALRAIRAGITWRVARASDGTASELPLWRLRDLAVRDAVREPDRADYLKGVLAAEQRTYVIQQN